VLYRFGCFGVGVCLGGVLVSHVLLLDKIS
jgi:hypothetical protein